MKVLARHTFWAMSLIAMVAMMALSSCSSENGGTQATVPGAAAPVVVASTCAIGQIDYNGVCLNNNYGNCAQYGPNYGWNGSTGTCVAGTLITTSPTSSNALNFYGAITSINTQNFELLLQTSGACSTWQYSGGYRCNRYTGAGYVVLQMTNPGNGSLPTQATLQLGAGSSNPSIGNTSNWTGGTIIQVNGTMNLSPYMGGAGFWASNAASTGSVGGLQILVESGLPQSAYQMNYTIEYNGQLLGRGVLKRY